VPGVMVPVLSSVWRSCLGVATNADLSFILVQQLEAETPVTTESSVELRLDSTSNKLDFLMMLGQWRPHAFAVICVGPFGRQ